MALVEMDATCTACGTRQRGTPTRSFFGFQQFVCSQCSARFLYPLTDGYLAFYWIIVALAVVSGLVITVQGRVPLPNIWALLVGIALIRDAVIRKRVAAAEAKSATR